jgi:hypothetical protein
MSVVPRRFMRGGGEHDGVSPSERHRILHFVKIIIVVHFFRGCVFVEPGRLLRRRAFTSKGAAEACVRPSRAGATVERRRHLSYMVGARAPPRALLKMRFTLSFFFLPSSRPWQIMPA